MLYLPGRTEKAFQINPIEDDTFEIKSNILNYSGKSFTIEDSLLEFLQRQLEVEEQKEFEKQIRLVMGLDVVVDYESTKVKTATIIEYSKMTYSGIRNFLGGHEWNFRTVILGSLLKARCEATGTLIAISPDNSGVFTLYRDFPIRISNLWEGRRQLNTKEFNVVKNDIVVKEKILRYKAIDVDDLLQIINSKKRYFKIPIDETEIELLNTNNKKLSIGYVFSKLRGTKLRQKTKSHDSAAKDFFALESFAQNILEKSYDIS